MAWLSLDCESLDFVRTVTARGFSPTNLDISISAWSPFGESTSVTCNQYRVNFKYISLEPTIAAIKEVCMSGMVNIAYLFPIGINGISRYRTR